MNSSSCLEHNSSEVSIQTGHKHQFTLKGIWFFHQPSVSGETFPFGALKFPTLAIKLHWDLSSWQVETVAWNVECDMFKEKKSDQIPYGEKSKAN